MKVRHVFIPSKHNNHRPYLLRYQALSIFVTIVMLFQAFINIFYFNTPQVLGFATSIHAGEIISLTNVQRANNGAGPVIENAKLNQAAQLKAQNMFQDNYWAHTNPYDTEKDPWYWFEDVGYAYFMAGENLAMNFDTSAGVVNGWMNSPSHRENLLNEYYTEIGVAVVNGVLLGEETTLVVQLFGRPLNADVPSFASTQGTVNNPTPTAIIAQQPTTAPTVTPTPEPTPTPTPEPQTVSAIVKNVSGGTPTQTNATLFGGEQRWKTIQANLTSPFSLNIGRLVMLGALVFLMSVFLIDSLVILHRQNFQIARSHGFVHVGIMGIMAIALLYNSVGAIL